MNAKGLIKVYNGEKFKTVSYKNDKGCITFTTSCKSNKYNEFVNTGKIKLENSKQYDVTLVEDEKTVDKIFNELKTEKVIPFFIPRKNKIIVKFDITE